MIRQLAHVCITASDLAEVERFYCDVLGLEVIFTFIRQGERHGFYLGCGGTTFIEVFKGTPAGDGSIRHFCLEVDDIDAAIVRCERHGVSCKPRKQGADQSWQTWIDAPDGIRIELHHYTETSSQRTGADCVVNW